MFQLPVLCVFFVCLFVLQNSYISWLLPFLFRAGPQNYLRGCLPNLSPQQIHQIKHNFQFLGLHFFFELTIINLMTNFPANEENLFSVEIKGNVKKTLGDL